jgi:sugar lactone lactonase YvrE
MPFDPTKAKLEKDFTADAPLTACRFSPDGRFVFAGAQDENVYRFELATGTKTIMTGHESWIAALAVTPDGATLISGGCDDTLRWWPAAAENPAAARVLKAHDGWVRAVAVSPDGTLVASGGNDRRARLWKTDDGSPVRDLPGAERDIYSLVFTADGTSLLAGDLDGKIHQWTVATGERTRALEAPGLHLYEGGQQVHYGGVRALALSPDGQWLVAAGLSKATNPLGNVQEPLAVRLAWKDGSVAKNHVADGLANHTLWGACFHPDGLLVACVGGNSGHLLFWGPDDEKPIHKFDLPVQARGLDLHPATGKIATIHHDGHLRLVGFE